MDSQTLILGEAANQYLAEMAIEEREASQTEVHKFVRWFGRERPFDKLTAAEVANYAERLSISDTDYLNKLGPVRVFLASARKKGWSKTNLAVHLKAKREKPKAHTAAKRRSKESISLTREGHTELKAELASLHSKRLETIDEIRRAAADKDFRENVPLQAAREQRGHIEGRIIELEAALKSAVIVDEKQERTSRIGIGDRVILYDPVTGEKLKYILVNPREVNPAQGKISSASPIGQAILGRQPGEVVEISAPAGKLKYQIEHVER